VCVTRRRAIARAVFRIALRTLKWGTLAAALIVTGVWVGGSVTKFYWHKIETLERIEIVGTTGSVVVMWDDLWFMGQDFDLDRALLLVPGRSPINASSDRWPRAWLPSASGLGTGYGHIYLPYWLPILLFASISGGLFWRDRRAERRARVGMCPSCGYSRAGLPLDAKCPECGKPKV